MNELSSQEVVDPAAAHSPVNLKPDETGKFGSPKRKRWKAGLGVLLVIGLIAGLAYPSLRADYHERRTKEFKQRCKTAAALTDWDALQAAAEEWADWDPESNDALIFLGEAALQHDELEQTVDYLGRIDDSYHSVLQALALRGDILFSDLNRPFEAEQNWQRMLAINDKATLAHQRLIYFYAMTLQRKKMIDQIHRAIEHGCEPPEAYSYLLLSNSLNFSDGLTVMTRWRSQHPDDVTLEVAQAVYAAKKTPENEMATFGIQTVIPGDQSLLDSCLRKYPSHLELLSLSIELAMIQGETETATRLLSQASAEAETDSRFWRYRGWLFEQRGRHQQAAESLERALELNPFEWQSRWLLADIYRKLNLVQKADKQAQIASQGKDLQEKIFEQPTARDLDHELLHKIYQYLTEIHVPELQMALGRRLDSVDARSEF